MSGPGGELRLLCDPAHVDELLARTRAAFPIVGTARGPYPTRPRRRRHGAADGDAGDGMVRVYLDLDRPAPPSAPAR